MTPCNGATGQGRPARWSVADVVRLGTIAALQRAGFTLEAAVRLSGEAADDG